MPPAPCTTRRLLATLAVATAALAVATAALGCGSAEPGGGATSGGDAGVSPAPTADGGDAGRSPGCAVAPAPGLQAREVSVGGATRRYQVFTPAGAVAGRPMALAFVLHGRGGDGNQIRSYLGMETEAAGQAIFVYPDGLPQPSQGGVTAWSLADVAFFDAMLSEVSSAACIDSARVFAAGHSFGAYFANVLGCERGDRLRGIAAVSGGVVPESCKGPVAAWISHGESDATVPLSEGVAARDRWVKLNGCGGRTHATTPGACVAYEGCSEGRPVVYCPFPGGHYPLPDTTRQAIWDFFKGL